MLINSKYNGPPDSGNGGYCCGLFALSLDPGATEALEVTLRKPPPLDTVLSAVPTDEGMEIRDDANIVALVKPTSVDFAPLPAPSLQQAREAESRYTGFCSHPFPTCFVCGPQRTEEDGLRLFPGSLSEPAVAGQPVACVWQPYEALADEQGNLRPEFIWAALDCPTYFGAYNALGNPTAVLGRQAVQILQRRLPANQDYLLQSWQLDHDGRKCHSAGALYTLDGQCVALCRATWIRL